jgi:predicted DNA binding protein
MWTLKLKLNSEKQLLGRLAIKHNITMSGYPISSIQKRSHIEIINFGIMFGNEENKINLIKDLKESKEITNIEITNNSVIIQSKVSSFMKPFFNPEIIQIKPVLIDPKTKTHTWEIASFKRELLEKVLKFSKEKLGAKLIKFKQENIENIAITSIKPNLSKKQQQAFELAVLHGYYEYPKKITMPNLAKLMKISYATYQEHLKKAESKLIPSLK